MLDNEWDRISWAWSVVRSFERTGQRPRHDRPKGTDLIWAPRAMILAWRPTADLDPRHEIVRPR